MPVRRSRFRHPPVPGDAGQADMPDTADVCRTLTGLSLSQRPATGNTRSR